MKLNSNRVMIAATSSGSGKTTVFCGILKALLNRNIKPASFKCGPDYIDPLFHKRTIGVASRNLDLFLNDEESVKYLLGKNSKNTDISLIEGVMGYYDGISTKSFKGSSYDLAKVTKTPVVLVIDAKGKYTSIVAEVKGFLELRDDSFIKGVILNNMSSMLYGDIKELIERELNIKVIGYLERNSDFNIESRHLGLVTADEISGIEDKIERIAAQVERTINIESIVEIAESAEEIEYESIEVRPLEKTRIAVARDKAFCFYYEDNLDLLREIGCEIVEFSPLRDKNLPDNIDGLILGGGYPELNCTEISSNESMLNDIKSSLENGLPCIAECGGFMYLNKVLEDSNGNEHKMVGYFNSRSFNSGKLSRFGYITLTAKVDNLLCRKGERVAAHEFHYWDSSENGETFSGKKPLRNRGWDCINYKDNVIAGYPHIHFYSNMDFAYNFVGKCIEEKHRR